MSFDDLHSSLASDGRPATKVLDIELDVELSSSLTAESEEIPADDSELSELLAHLDSADTMASGVEARLDGILGTLDKLLTSLEPEGSDEPHGSTIPHSRSQSGCPPSEEL